METLREKQNKVFETLKSDFSYKNVMQTPRIKKVVINVGVGKTKADKKKVELIPERLAHITGQKPTIRPAKKSIASFKVREGQLSGYQVTLRGKRMQDFLDKLLNVALPRTRDFRGLNPGSIDMMGNYTIGIPENTIFPETADEDVANVFGLAITVVTTASDPDEVRAYLKYLGFPFREGK